MTTLIISSTQALDAVTEHCLALGIDCYCQRVWADGVEPYGYQIRVCSSSSQLTVILLKYSDYISVVEL